jgi:hypothetical protein
VIGRIRLLRCPGCEQWIHVVDAIDAPDGRTTASHPAPVCGEFIRRMEAAGLELVSSEDDEETPPEGTELN